MSDFNSIGISRQFDRQCIQKLLFIGLFASLLHLVGNLRMFGGLLFAMKKYKI